MISKVVLPGLKKIVIRRPADFHVHFREGDMLKLLLPYTARYFSRALIMPNTSEPILTGTNALEYKQRIISTSRELGCNNFTPLMSIQITPQTTPRIIIAARAMGVIAGKVYSKGMTTNSENGVVDYFALTPVWEAMAEVGMIASFHGELPGVFCLDREKAFLDTFKEISRRAPKLKMVLEHVTTREAVSAVGRLPDTVAATITAHHLCLTLDDVVGSKLQPHNFCKPIAKRPEDRQALLLAATCGNPKFFFGSDTAPHVRGQKECAEGCAGVFSAPVALSVLAREFDVLGCLDQLEAFTSVRGPVFYGLSPDKDSLTLETKSWMVPEEIGGVVPFLAGQVLEWQAQE